MAQLANQLPDFRNRQGLDPLKCAVRLDLNGNEARATPHILPRSQNTPTTTILGRPMPTEIQTTTLFHTPKRHHRRYTHIP